jgi:hypothetical protein
MNVLRENVVSFIVHRHDSIRHFQTNVVYRCDDFGYTYIDSSHELDTSKKCLRK